MEKRILIKASSPSNKTKCGGNCHFYVQITQPCGKRKWKVTIALLSVICIVAFWFLGVDTSWFAEDCPDCAYGRDIYQIRIFTIPIYQRTVVYNTPLQKMAEDLGVPCRHPHLERWHVDRYWGLIIRGWPSFDGTIRLAGDDEWYDERNREIVRNLAKVNPALPKEFQKRVLEEHDWEYLRAFSKKVNALRKEPSVPGASPATP